jgi:superfamily II DNA or RNA helicase
MPPKHSAMFSAVLHDVANKSIVYSSSDMTLHTKNKRLKEALAKLAPEHVKFVGVQLGRGESNNGIMFRTTQNEWFALNKGEQLCEPGISDKLFERRLKSLFTTRVRKLMMHQKTVAEHFASHDWRRDRMRRPFLMMWDMGGGKTIGALETVLGSKKPPHKLVVVCANTMIDYWADNVRGTALGAPTNTYTIILGYTEFKRDPSIARRADVVIVDEAHTFKNLNADALQAIEALKKTRNLFLLTGTPIVNGSDDLKGMLSMMGEDVCAAEDTRNNTQGVIWTRGGKETYIVGGSNSWDLDAVKAVFDGNVSFFSPKIHGAKDYSETYPRVESSVLSVPCSPVHAVAYLARRNYMTLAVGGERVRRKTGFMNNYNKAQIMFLNDDDAELGYSTKAREVASRIKRGTVKRPCVVYSAYLDAGVDIMSEELSGTRGGTNIPQRTLTGRTPTAERQEIVKQFNAGKLPVMQISAAGGTGINLLGAKTMFCMNACDNLETEAQVRGRVVRMDSHPGGHKELVQYFKVNAVFPKSVKTVAAAMKMPPHTKREIRNMYVQVFGDRYMHGVTDRELMENVVHAVMNEENGMTIDEQLDQRNRMKQAQVDRVSNVIRDCSIKMPIGSMKTGGVTFSRNMAALMATKDIKDALATGRATIPASRIQTIKKASAPQWKAWNNTAITPRSFSMLVTKAVEAVMKNNTNWLPRQPKALADEPEFQAALRAEVSKQIAARPCPSKKPKSAPQPPKKKARK